MTFHDIQTKASVLFSDRRAAVSEYIRAAALLEAVKENAPSYMRPVRAAFVSSFTLQGLPEVFRVRAIFHNLLAETYLAPYNQFTQQILDEKSELYKFAPTLIYFILDGRDIREMERIHELIDACRRVIGVPIAIANFTGSPDFSSADAQRLNAGLRERCGADPKVHGMDFDGFLNTIGKESVWYTKYTELGDMRLSPQAFPDFSEFLMHTAIAVTGATKKCLVLDLDNTLWKGVAGEDARNEIIPDTAIQDYARELHRRGILLAINSKNNPEDALACLALPDMRLHREDFAAERINWNTKDINMTELADELNLGTESFAFADDDELNLALIRARFPEIAVMRGEDLHRYAGFASLALSEEDIRRNAMYAEERKRKEFRVSARSVGDFLRDLKLEVTCRLAADDTIPRVSQLTQKTNQFNLTTRRYTSDEIRAMIGRGWKVLTISVRDAFGDYGIVGVGIVDTSSPEWRLDSFLMSCRVLGRGIEQAFLSFILDMARQAGGIRAMGEFIPTAKNAPGAGFLKENGFTLSQKIGDRQVYYYELARPFAPPDYVTFR